MIAIQREQIKSLDHRVKANALQLREVSAVVNTASRTLETLARNRQQRIRVYDLSKRLLYTIDSDVKIIVSNGTRHPQTQAIKA